MLLISIRALRITLFALAILPGWATWAETLPSSITLEGIADSEQGRHGSAGLDLFFLNNLNAHIEAGRSNTNPDDADKETVSTTVAMGLGTDPSRRLSAGVDYDHWGLQDVFTSVIWFFPLQVRIRDWTVGLRYGRGDIAFQSIEVLGVTRKIEAAQEVTGGQISYKGFKNWVLRGAYETYEYDRDVTLLSTPFIANFFSDSTLSLVSSLKNYSARVGATYQFQNFDLGIDVSETESAFDESVFLSTEISVDYYLDDRWTLLFSLGAVHVTEGASAASETSEDQRQLGLGFSYQWGQNSSGDSNVSF